MSFSANSRISSVQCGWITVRPIGRSPTRPSCKRSFLIEAAVIGEDELKIFGSDRFKI